MGETKHDEPRDDEALTEFLSPPSTPWPRGRRTLFGWTSDCNTNACVDLLRGDVDGYVRGYCAAARILFDAVSRDSTSMDSCALVILFSWRQAVELQLKQVIRLDALLEGRDAWLKPTHGLARLWDQARPVIEALDRDEEGCIPASADVIRQLDAVDPRSIDFRYATDNDGRPTLSRLPSVVNLREVHDALTGVTNFLGAVVGMLDDRLSYVRENQR